MVTLKQVADKAGVSIRTVTRMLKNEPGGNLQTYERVKAVANRLGYVPNMAARNLKIRHSTMIGMVTSMRHTEVTTRIQAALQRRLEMEGRYILSGASMASEATLRAMLASWSGLTREVVFLAWPPAFQPSTVLAGLPMRFIFIDCLYDQTTYDAVLTDRTIGIRDSVLHFIRTGRRHIVRCGVDSPTRRRGFDAAFRGEPKPQASRHIIVTKGLEYADGYDAGPAIIAEKADAVFFETDRMAFGFYQFAFERGIRIPGDMAVTGFDDETAGRYACPPLSTVAHPIAEITEQVFTMLMAPPRPTQQVTFSTHFVPRQSS
jgi:LacI family transcriptional regulator